MLDSREYDQRDEKECPTHEDEDPLQKITAELKTQTERLNYKIFQLKKLAEFHQMGKLTTRN
jgi:hypothetical protein